MDLSLFDTLVRGMGVGVALLLSVQMALNLRDSPTSVFGMLFAIGVASYLACSAKWFADLPLLFNAPLMFFCIFNPLLFWLFAQSLFNDQFSMGLSKKLVSAAFVGVVIVYYLSSLLSNESLKSIVETLHNIFALVLILHILVDVIRGRSGDLIEARRQLRTYVVILSGGYMMLVIAAEMVLAGAPPTDLLILANAVGIGSLTFGIVLFALQLRAEILPPIPGAGAVLTPESNRPVSVLDNDVLPALAQNSLQLLISQIQELMEAQTLYRQEGLTVGALAKQLEVPEYRLRRAINQGMGYRNFNSFLNYHRLCEVENALANPSKRELPVLSIAFSAGFNSLGPFNKAFKEKTGMTPSEFRRFKMRSDQ